MTTNEIHNLQQRRNFKTDRELLRDEMNAALDLEQQFRRMGEDYAADGMALRALDLQNLLDGED